MNSRSTRRNFLKASSIAAAGLWTGRRVWGSSTQPATEKLGLAVVGCGAHTQGRWNLEQLKHTGEAIVALCDVDEALVAETLKQFPDAKYYTDFRQMLDKSDKDIDAVLVATPDHTHAAATMAAMKAGKHAYCEKPLTHNVWECRQLMEAARKLNRVTQMGTQMHSSTNYRRVVELVQSGAVGAIREVHVWCPTVWSGGVRPKESSPVPPTLHWDLWLGPAPERPFVEKIYTPSTWRGWWDFGGGGHGDMACHYFDLVHWALELSYPAAVETEGPPVDADSAPNKLTVRYEYPARGSKPAVKLTWCVGVNRPDNFVEGQMPAWDAGILFVGEKGTIAADYGQYKLLPEKDFADFKPPAPTIPDSPGHHKEWVEACKGNGKTNCHFDYAGVLAETALLGNVAYRSGGRIEYDAANMRITNNRDAEKFLRREPRKGWSL